MRISAPLVAVAWGATLWAGCGSANPPLLQGSLNSADFFSLFERESETLGADLVGREEYDLRPAETRPYRRQLQPDTKVVGVIAAFRDLENSRWRQVAAVPPKKPVSIAIGVEAHAVRMAVK